MYFTYYIYISVIAGILLQSGERGVMVNIGLIRELVVTYNADKVHVSKKIYIFSNSSSLKNNILVHIAHSRACGQMDAYLHPRCIF